MTKIPKMAMNFADGSNGNQMREEYRGKSTMDLILAGKRTATSRDFSKSYNRNVPQIGELVIFHDSKGREALCRVTSAPKPICEIDPEIWSQKEGWAPSVHHKLSRFGDYHQFEYVLVKK